MQHMSLAEFNGYIDHTLLKPDSSRPQVEKLCAEALVAGFASVCVLPHYVSPASSLLTGSGVAVCTVIGFPLGATFTRAKLAEAELAIEYGAQELDMVINNAALKSGDFLAVREDIDAIAGLCELNGALLKVIIETSLLTREEKLELCSIVSDSGAAFIKTSTGFVGGGATVDDVRLLAENCKAKVKASGGIRELPFALELIEAGAKRLGTSSGMKLSEAYALTVK